MQSGDGIASYHRGQLALVLDKDRKFGKSSTHFVATEHPTGTQPPGGPHTELCGGSYDAPSESAAGHRAASTPLMLILPGHHRRQ